MIIPACQPVKIHLLPSGQFLQITENNSGATSTYLLDLQTTEKIEVTNQQFTEFLTDDLGFIEDGIEDYIVERETGRQYPIPIFRFWRDNAYVNGEPNLELLVSALRQAEHIFFTQNNDTVIVLMPSFQTNLGQNFTFDRSDIIGGDPDKVEQFLQGNKIVYQTVLANFPDEAVSRDRRFVARPDGIYLVETRQKIIEGFSFSKSYRAYSGKYFAIRGWTSDGSGAIYSSFLLPCLIETKFIFLDDTGCFIDVPQPVIKLKVPEQYLLSQETP